MKAVDYSRLVLLSAIWAASFIFMRVAAPTFGSVWTAEGRLLIAGLVLAAWLHLAGFNPQWRRIDSRRDGPRHARLKSCPWPPIQIYSVRSLYPASRSPTAS